MLKFVIRKGLPFARTCSAWVLIVLGSSSSNNLQAQADCANLLSAGPVIVPGSGGKVIIGQTVTVKSFTVAPGPNNCFLQNGEAYYAQPNGTVTKVLQGFQLPRGSSPIDCLGAVGGTCLGFPNTYVVDPNDINRRLQIVLPPNGQFDGATEVYEGRPGEIHFFGAGSAEGFQPDAPSVRTGAASGTGRQLLQVVTPCIAITKECVLPPGRNCYMPGETIAFRGRVCNSGDTALGSIVATDTPNGPYVAGSLTFAFAANTGNGRPFDPNAPNALLPGECVDYSGSYTPSGTYNQLLTDKTNTVAVSAIPVGVFGFPRISNTDACWSVVNGTYTSTGPRPPVTSVCPVCPLPKICVVKEVACLLPGGICGNYDKTATGVKDSDCPTFCYRITVINCGPDALRNVRVVDDRLSLANCNFPTTLAIGQSVSCVIQSEQCASVLNTVTASGIGVSSGVYTNAIDHAMVVVKPASIACELTLTSSFDMDEANCADNVPPAPPNPCDNHLLLPDGFNGSVALYIKVSNTGQAELKNIRLAGLPAGCEPAIPATLAPGASFIATCNPTIVCPGGARYDVTVTADASDENGQVCVYDRNGVTIDVNSRCYALAECKPPEACRTTGGGKQYPSADVNGAAPDELPANLFPANVTYVTHGGQVGASLGRAACFSPEDHCITGQWQHVRHNKDGSEGNFHSDYFDSLLCACLGCTDPVTGAFIRPITQGSLCNPDNRLCGPEPRRAPANAIMFTGVGNWTDSPGKRAPQSVVFRVYIEDRSEPGGSPPGQHHAEDPPDVYCIQIWKITGNPNSANNLALRRAVACNIEAGVNVPPAAAAIRAPDVSDCGPVSRGNHQIHPSTGRTCP